MKTQIFKSYEDFLEREDKSMNGVSEDFAAEHPDYEKDNRSNSGCWNCYDCRGCYDCNNCYHCDFCQSLESCEFCGFLTDCKGGKNL